MTFREPLLVLLLALDSRVATPAGPTLQPGKTVQACDASDLLIRNVSLWTAARLLPKRDVLFARGRVAAVESAGSRAHDGVRSIDGAGHTLLPGLVDTHLHFSVPGGLPPGDGPRTDALEITGRQLLRSGVTAGRLHLATIEEATRLKARGLDTCQPTPLLQVGGPGLSGAVQRDFGNFQGVKSREDALAKIERMRVAGIDWVAIHDADKFDAALLQAIAETARKAGIRLMAAGNTPQEILAALTIDPDTLDYFDRSAEPLYAQSTLDAIGSHRDLVLAPTPGVAYRTGQYRQHPSWVENEQNFEFFDAFDRPFVAANAAAHRTGADAERTVRVLPSLPGKFGQLRQLGLPMAIASDAGSPLHFQSNAIWWELEAWRASGASHREALIAATVNAARVLRANDVGRLDIGSRADFVLYRGNVEEGAFDLARVIAVGKAGVVYVREGHWVGPSN